MKRNYFMKLTSVFKFFIICFVTLSGCTLASEDDNPVARMAQRLFPQHADSFVFVVEPDSVGPDRFSLESVDGKIVVTGNNNNSLAVGLNHYLKNFCNTRVSWYAADSIIMPDVLPAVPERIEAVADVDNRFFLNYCTYGYSMPYWKWADWEEQWTRDHKTYPVVSGEHPVTVGRRLAEKYQQFFR